MKKKKIFTTIIILTALFTAKNSSAQVLTDIQNSFNNYNQNTLQEKLFVHTDKDFYLAGELLWLKIYSVSGFDNKPLDASKVAYVEILDKDNNPLLQAKIEMNGGAGNSSFYLPVSATSGNYKIRAYTNWMKNFGPDKYFEKNITLINSLKALTLQTTKPPAAYDVQFFPEGGEMVNGLNSKIAFRVAGTNGKGAEFTGAIINQRNDTITRFKPYKFGLGTFMLKPEAANTYRAVIKFKDKTVTETLPTARAEGYVMQLTDAGANQLKVTVSYTGSNAGTIYLITHDRGTITEAKSITLTNGVADFLIDKGKLQEGISHITIFNGNKQPVCERLYMKRPGQQLLIDAGTDKAEYGTRKKVNIALAAKDKTSKAENANISVAVYRTDSLQNTDPESIYTYLWLSSELKGNIESPEYYVNAGADDSEAIDNLMLTHGWSKYNWDAVLTANAPAFKYLPELDAHIITGRVTGPVTGNPVKNERILLSVPGKRIQLYNALSNADGGFFINTKDFVGQNEIVVQPRLEKDTLLKLQIFNPFSEAYSVNKLSEFSLPKELYSSILTHSMGMQVQNLYSGEKIKQQYAPVVDTTALFNGAQKTYLLDDYTRFTTMEEVLREYIHEAIVSKAKNDFRIHMFNDDYYMDKLPLLLFDGVPVYSINKVVAADPLKVRRIEVVPNIYYRGSMTEYGLISFTTYKGDLGGVEIDPHALVMDYEGLQLKRSFFSPVYETELQVNGHLPDFRTLLYWSPEVNTDANGKAALSFYTSDQPGNYMGVVQGITADGKAGMHVFNFEVKGSVAP